MNEKIKKSYLRIRKFKKNQMKILKLKNIISEDIWNKSNWMNLTVE